MDTAENELPRRVRKTPTAHNGNGAKPLAADENKYIRLLELLDERPTGYELELHGLARELAKADLTDEQKAYVHHAVGLTEIRIVEKIAYLNLSAAAAGTRYAQISGDARPLVAIVIDHATLVLRMEDGKKLASDALTQLIKMLPILVGNNELHVAELQRLVADTLHGTQAVD